MRAFLSRSVFLLVAATLACESSVPDFAVGPDQPQTIQASAIALSSSAPSLVVGQSVQLSAVVLDASGNAIPNSTVNWSSSNTSIATVTTTGLVAAVALGTATVTASSGSLSKSATVAVAASSTPTTPPPTSPATGPVALPVLMDTPMPTAPAAGGKIISVAATDDLQSAINAAQPGDVVELARGATYRGNYTLPDKGSSSAWIVIRPASGAALPAEGQRMTPALASSLQLPRIVTPDYQYALHTAPSAHHYRIIGIEIAVEATAATNYGLVLLDGGDGNTGQTSAQVPHDLIFDRVYLHGNSVTSLKRCITLNSAASAVLDSYLSECHAEGQDAQAILGYNGPGPFKIVNNYLEGSGENIMFGGADPSIPNLVPSDIEIRHNHIAKPSSWHGGRWVIKNLLELKSAQRVLIEGNIFENNWANGQEGSGIVMWSANQSGTAPWTVTQDVTFRLNVMRNVGAGFQISSSAVYPSVHARRFAFTDNLIYGINQPGFEGNGRGFQVFGDVADVSISHNTLIGATSTAITLGPPGTATVRLNIRENILDGGQYGIFGDNSGAGTASFSLYAPDGTFLQNVLVYAYGAGTTFPTGNSYPTAVGAIGFMNIAAADYHLSPISPFKAPAGSRDPGADIDTVNAATAGVVVP